MLAGGGEHGLQVHVVRVPGTQEPAGRVGENVNLWVTERPHDSRSHLLTRLLEARVDGRQDEVELVQHLVGEVHRAVGEDSALAGGQDTDSMGRLELPDPAHLSAQLVDAEAARDGIRPRVVGDGDVLVAAFLGGRHQLLEREVTVRPVRVSVEIATDRAGRHQLGQAPVPGGLDLAGVLAQLRGNPRQSHRRVHVLLGVPGDAPAALLLEDAILADRQPATPGQLAHADVVIPGPREVLERGAERLGRDDAQIDLKPVLVADRCLGVATRDDFDH